MKKNILIGLLISGLLMYKYNVFEYISLTNFTEIPTDDEVQAVLAEKVNRTGCLRSRSFASFPIQTQYERTLNSLKIIESNTGLIQSTPAGFILTEKGNLYYDANKSGFCFTDYFVVSDISTSPYLRTHTMPSLFSSAWLVTFSLKPNQMAEWSNQKVLDKAISAAPPSVYSNYYKGKKYFVTLRMARKKGDPKLYLVDPYADYTMGALDMGLTVQHEQTKTGSYYDTEFP